MPTPIEVREYKEPVWVRFNWEINGQRISGVYSELDGGGENLKKIRMAIAVPADAQDVVIDIRFRERVERDPKSPGQRVTDKKEEYFVVSYWSPGLRIGNLVSFPRELVERRDEGGPLFIQVEQVSVYSYDSSNRPTYWTLI